VKQNAQHRAAGWTKKRHKGLDQPPHFVFPTLTYQLGRDYGVKADQQVSVLTLAGRIVVAYSGYGRHIAFIQHEAALGAAKLWYDKPCKQFYLLVSFTVEVPDSTLDSTPAVQWQIVGVDVGQRYLAVATNMQNQTQFFSGSETRAKADHYARLRKRLQHKGTRSATRRLVVLAGRERRLKHERNHHISRQVVDTYRHSLIGLEDLTHIRERTKRRRRLGKRATVKQRRANRHASRWAFAELHSYVAYKALLVAVWP
jgi:putative transposase